MSSWNSMLSWVEHEKKFYNLGAWRSVCPDLGPNCLQHLSADDKSSCSKESGIYQNLRTGSNSFHMSWLICMGDYSWIQDFEADFPQKVSLKMLN